MSWPPSYSAAFIGAGYTTVKWGTDGLLPSDALTNGTTSNIGGSFIVVSLRSMDIFETIYIENGTGLRATRIGLIQGREMELTVVDDSGGGAYSGLHQPTYGTQLTLIDPISSTTMLMTVIDNSYNAARKQEGQRVFRVVFDTLIEGGGSIPT